jgi:hypothetical protein
MLEILEENEKRLRAPLYHARGEHQQLAAVHDLRELATSLIGGVD